MLEQRNLESLLVHPGWHWLVARVTARRERYRDQLEIKKSDELTKLQGNCAEIVFLLDEPRTRLLQIAAEMNKAGRGGTNAG